MPVNTQHPEYKAMLPKWERCRTVASGVESGHAAGEKYLSKLKSQPQSDYDVYRLRTVFYNATWRTIAGLVGMLFRKPPTIEVPPSVEPLLEDVDGAAP